MITLRHNLETFFFIAFATTAILFFMVQRNNKTSLPAFATLPPVVETPIPTISPQETYMDSPEGSKTLTLEKLDREGITTYLLYVTFKSDEQKQQIFKKEMPLSQSFEIPYNAWSPDTKYLFLKEKNPTLDNYLVFQSSGSPFSNDRAYLSIQELFQKKVQNYTIEDVTGWADLPLLMVNTKANDSDKKVSFWFDVPSQSFVQLGTYFK
ncbi:MAG: hypothetical protein V1922_00150 [bacterium]